jgi:Domain of unknown function (DUF1844)
VTEKKAPQLDFNAFVLSLGSSALIHLGLSPDPDAKGEPPKKDLALAQQSIDLLALLQEKTRGNLTPNEEGFLRNLLYDLRLRYVEAARK